MRISTIVQDYFKTSLVELKKVIWPTREQTVRYSLIVIAMSVVTAAFFSILDYVFNLGLDKIILPH